MGVPYNIVHVGMYMSSMIRYYHLRNKRSNYFYFSTMYLSIIYNYENFSPPDIFLSLIFYSSWVAVQDSSTLAPLPWPAKTRKTKKQYIIKIKHELACGATNRCSASTMHLAHPVHAHTQDHIIRKGDEPILAFKIMLIGRPGLTLLPYDILELIQASSSAISYVDAFQGPCTR